MEGGTEVGKRDDRRREALKKGIAKWVRSQGSQVCHPTPCYHPPWVIYHTEAERQKDGLTGRRDTPAFPRFPRTRLNVSLSHDEHTKKPYLTREKPRSIAYYRCRETEKERQRKKEKERFHFKSWGKRAIISLASPHDINIMKQILLQTWRKRKQVHGQYT